MSSTREEATAARRDQIVRATIAQLAERGYQATTFEAICRAAGLSSKRLITYHFAGKEELLAAVAEHVVAVAEGHLQPVLDAATGHRELLAAVIRGSVTFIAGHPEHVRALQQIILNGDLAWERHHEESVRRLTGLFADGQRAGAFRPADPHVLATVLRAAIDSMPAPLAAGLDPATCADELVELFDRATRTD